LVNSTLTSMHLSLKKKNLQGSEIAASGAAHLVEGLRADLPAAGSAGSVVTAAAASVVKGGWGGVVKGGVGRGPPAGSEGSVKRDLEAIKRDPEGCVVPAPAAGKLQETDTAIKRDLEAIKRDPEGSVVTAAAAAKLAAAKKCDERDLHADPKRDLEAIKRDLQGSVAAAAKKGESKQKPLQGLPPSSSSSSSSSCSSEEEGEEEERPGGQPRGEAEDVSQEYTRKEVRGRTEVRQRVANVFPMCC